MNMSVPGLPIAGLTDRQLEQLETLAATLGQEQMLWASGYLAGMAKASFTTSGKLAAVPLQPDATASGSTSLMLTILYASETGNAANLARRLEARAVDLGFKANASDLATYKTRALKDESIILAISSTHGEGDPPESSASFFEFLNGRKAPKLDGARFAVLGLGDTTYEFFCEAAKALDRRLEELGAARLYQCVECDVDYEDQADDWIDTVLDKLSVENSSRPIPSVSSSMPQTSVSDTNVGGAIYDKRNPFPAPVIENIPITGRGSSKETRHIEFGLEQSCLVYEPGDALGIVACNDPALVEEILEKTGFSGGEHIVLKRGEAVLSDALTLDFEITALTPKFLQHWATLSAANELQALVAEGNRSNLNAFMQEHQIIDVVRNYPLPGLEADKFTSALRGLQPRLYSIASSQLAATDEVHITVSAVRYELHGSDRTGVASCYLADRVGLDDVVPVYIQQNDNFRLPNDQQASIIMIGAGTGVAPFRSFVQHREMEGSEGKSWLLFGERNFRTDFLYQTEWQSWLKDGVLSRMDVAFSRDQAHKRYVQHSLRENATEIYAWLEDGAYLYLCGDAEKLAPDVHEALLSVAEMQGAMTREDAGEYLRNLQRDGRYQRDVY